MLDDHVEERVVIDSVGLHHHLHHLQETFAEI